MDGIEVIRSQYKGAHGLMEATLGNITAEQAHWAPPGVANPLGATYVHAVAAEDALLNSVAKGGVPLFASTFQGKMGASEPPPGPGGGLEAWSRSVQIDIAQARAYAQAVYASTDEYLASLTAEDLDRQIDMSRFGMGQQPLNTLVGNLVLQHINNHCGEIACLKGLQGAKGYPF
jgi:hypothetical protein